MQHHDHGCDNCDHVFRIDPETRLRCMAPGAEPRLLLPPHIWPTAMVMVNDENMCGSDRKWFAPRAEDCALPVWYL